MSILNVLLFVLVAVITIRMIIGIMEYLDYQNCISIFLFLCCIACSLDRLRTEIFQMFVGR